MRTANTKSNKAGASQSKASSANQQKTGEQQQQKQQQGGQQPNDLYFSMVNEMLCAERQITEALPKMAELATSEELKSTLNSHLQETQQQVERLTQIIQKLSKQEQKADCKSMKALLQEGPQMVQKMPEGDMRDLAIIAACRKVEYLEMSSYQSLMTLADMLQLDDHLDLLGKTLDEEENAAMKLGRAARTDDAGEMQMPNSMQAWPPFGAEDEKENVSMRSNERERDSQGRFMNEDEDRRDYSRGGYGHGGWYGDPRGHSEASREGWRHREDEDNGRRSRSYDYDDDRSGRSNYGRGGGGGYDRGQGGWFGDPEGRSEAAREGWRHREGGYGGGSRGGRDYDEDRGGRSNYGRGGGGGNDRGQGGWFGDPEGHSEASREGWRHREGGYGGGSRGGRDYDDDRGGRSNYGRGGNDRGHGGWFGDSEGHSEASREGWRHRENYGRGGRD